MHDIEKRKPIFTKAFTFNYSLQVGKETTYTKKGRTSNGVINERGRVTQWKEKTSRRRGLRRIPRSQPRSRRVFHRLIAIDPSVRLRVAKPRERLWRRPAAPTWKWKFPRAPPRHSFTPIFHCAAAARQRVSARETRAVRRKMCTEDLTDKVKNLLQFEAR